MTWLFNDCLASQLQFLKSHGLNGDRLDALVIEAYQVGKDCHLNNAPASFIVDLVTYLVLSGKAVAAGEPPPVAQPKWEDMR